MLSHISATRSHPCGLAKQKVAGSAQPYFVCAALAVEVSKLSDVA
jgi:hypothetical protein